MSSLSLSLDRFGLSASPLDEVGTALSWLLNPRRWFLHLLLLHWRWSWLLRLLLDLILGRLLSWRCLILRRWRLLLHLLRERILNLLLGWSRRLLLLVLAPLILISRLLRRSRLVASSILWCIRIGRKSPLILHLLCDLFFVVASAFLISIAFSALLSQTKCFLLLHVQIGVPWIVHLSGSWSLVLGGRTVDRPPQLGVLLVLQLVLEQVHVEHVATSHVFISSLERLAGFDGILKTDVEVLLVASQCQTDLESLVDLVNPRCQLLEVLALFESSRLIVPLGPGGPLLNFSIVVFDLMDKSIDCPCRFQLSGSRSGSHFDMKTHGVPGS